MNLPSGRDHFPRVADLAALAAAPGPLKGATFLDLCLCLRVGMFIGFNELCIFYDVAIVLGSIHSTSNSISMFATTFVVATFPMLKQLMIQ